MKDFWFWRQSMQIKRASPARSATFWSWISPKLSWKSTFWALYSIPLALSASPTSASLSLSLSVSLSLSFSLSLSIAIAICLPRGLKFDEGCVNLLVLDIVVFGGYSRMENIRILGKNGSRQHAARVALSSSRTTRGMAQTAAYVVSKFPLFAKPSS